MAVPSAEARLERIEEYRDRVLSQAWAGDIDRGEVRAFIVSLNSTRFASALYRKPHERPYIQPRGGFPLFEDQLLLSRALADAGADFVPLTIDSYTRHNDYDTAAELLQRSEDEGRDYLNGYPLICHGHQLSRDLFEHLDRPVSLRHGTPDARLLVETAIASGVTDIEGGGLCYCLPYSENFPLDRSLLYWQYVDRVCAIYSREGYEIQRESFGPLTATMVPPALAICVQIIEALLAAEQGVKSVTVSFGQNGSIVQDVATARVLMCLTRELLDRFGFGDVKAYLAYHQWMGQFPRDSARALALITGSAVVANMVGADKIVTKTVEEALGVPRREANAEAVSVVRYIFETFLADDEFTSRGIESEAALVESETRSILGAIFELPGDMFWQSVYRAFQLGYIDIPFAPHEENANRLLSIRDLAGSIRIADAGSVPIDADDAATEKKLLESRIVTAGKTYQHLLDDINRMA